MPIFVTVCVCAMPCPAIAVVSPPTPHRAVDGVKGCLPAVAAAILLSAVAQKPARPRQAGCKAVCAAYHRRRRRSAQRPGRAAAVQRGRYAVLFTQIWREWYVNGMLIKLVVALKDMETHT